MLLSIVNYAGKIGIIIIHFLTMMRKIGTIGMGFVIPNLEKQHCQVQVKK